MPIITHKTPELEGLRLMALHQYLDEMADIFVSHYELGIYQSTVVICHISQTTGAIFVFQPTPREVN